MVDPISKLVETIGHQVDCALEPGRIVARARAEGEAAIILAQAQGEVDLINLVNDSSLHKRAAIRLLRREARRQINLEAICNKAIDELPKAVSVDPVDQDWTAQFLDHAQDVGDEEMQKIWARILAGEVALPGSFSRRTFSVVKSLSRADAMLFTSFCSTIWEINGQIQPFLPHVVDIETQSMRINFDALIHLDYLGLVKTGSGFVEITPRLPGRSPFCYIAVYHEYRFVITTIEPLRVGPALLTEAGVELHTLANAVPDYEYMDELIVSPTGDFRITTEYPDNPPRARKATQAAS